ncbi:MAG: protein kinase, partial [Planctomycetales bacterium]|nr:protein kinase [Planctomycetales bacterium]
MNHPNIVQALDAGEVAGTHYLAMELLAGEDLSGVQRRWGRISVPEACELARQTALGLQYAHENGLIHRDIKPGNLMLSANEADGSPRVRILDLGLARIELA